MTESDSDIVVARFNTRPEAEIAKGFLEQAEIGCVLRADDGGGAFGAPLSYTLDSFAELVVLTEDAGRARQLLLDDGFTVLDEDGEEVEPSEE